MNATIELRWPAALVGLGLGLVACGRPDGYCPPFTYDAAPVELVLLDENDEPVCLTGTRRNKAFVVQNAKIKGTQVPESRDAGFSELLNILQNDCEYVLVGWYDPELGKALEIRLEPSGFEPVEFSVDFSREGECDEAVGKSVTLHLTPS